MFNFTVSTIHCHSNLRIVVMQTLSSLATLEIVKLTTFSAASDDKVGIIITIRFSVAWLHGNPADVVPRNNLQMNKEKGSDNDYLVTGCTLDCHFDDLRRR